MSKQIYAEVSAKILAQLESGVAPWVRPWSTSANGKSRMQPHNLVSNRNYNGINALILTMLGMKYPTGAWATYPQIKNAGGQVRKGEKGTQVVYFDRIEVKDRTAGAAEDATKRIPLLRYFTVFNHAQADWAKDPLASKKVDPADVSGDDEVPEAAATIAASGAKITHGGDMACYIPATDSIRMPAKKSFVSIDHYYGTAFHELTHWTAASSRLDRNLSGRFGDPSYAFEELVAEMGAAFLCATHRIDGELRHAEYLGHWMKAIKDDDQAIFKAAALAQKAAEFISGMAAKDEEEAA